jgi:hypothetical protein
MCDLKEKGHHLSKKKDIEPWSAANTTGKRKPRVRASAARARAQTHGHHPVTCPRPTCRRRSPPRTHTARVNTNQPPPFVLLRSRTRVLETIEIARSPPRIVERRRLLCCPCRD